MQIRLWEEPIEKLSRMIIIDSFMYITQRKIKQNKMIPCERSGGELRQTFPYIWICGIIIHIVHYKSVI